MGADAELPGIEPHVAGGEQRSSGLEGHGVEILADGEKLRGAAVELCSVDDHGGNNGRFATGFVELDEVHAGVAGEGEWLELCLGSILKRPSMPFRSWSSQVISLRI